jgi:alpha-D-ribose 1-methylphosphonate 5-triphosphate synthase subunit PhnG
VRRFVNPRRHGTAASARSGPPTFAGARLTSARRERRETVIERVEKGGMTGRDSRPDPDIANPEIAARRRAMAILARARRDELVQPIAARWPDHGARDLKPVETGLVMLRGRIGGDGQPFNLGEATVTRAAVELETGERGFAHILGRDAETARLAAIADALWQRETGDVETTILAPIAERLAAEAAKARAETAATRVDFFTLARGEDAA